MDNKSANNANGQVSLIAFIQRFPDNLSALLYLEEIRWHGKPCCPHCQSERVTLTDGNLRKYWCSTCRKRFSPTVNTIFHSHKIGLNIFFYAVWEVINSRKGIASVKLAKTLGVSQPTAWLILSRIRKAMEQNDPLLVPIGHTAAIDEAFFGGSNTNRHWDKRFSPEENMRQKEKFWCVTDLVTRQRYVKRVESIDRCSINELVLRCVEEGNVLVTDDGAHYTDLETFFTRKVVRHAHHRYMVDGLTTNAVESFWAVGKRGFMGVIHKFGKKHSQSYLDEYAYRLNHWPEGNPTYDSLDLFLSDVEGRCPTRAQRRRKQPTSENRRL